MAGASSGEEEGQATTELRGQGLWAAVRIWEAKGSLSRDHAWPGGGCEASLSGVLSGCRDQR